jgi:hypothetical protein
MVGALFGTHYPIVRKWGAVMTSAINWPSQESLAPKLERLRAEQGSVILVAITANEFGFLETSSGWFSASERESLKRALVKAKKARQAAAEAKP